MSPNCNNPRNQQAFQISDITPHVPPVWPLSTLATRSPVQSTLVPWLVPFSCTMWGEHQKQIRRSATAFLYNREFRSQNAQTLKCCLTNHDHDSMTPWLHNGCRPARTPSFNLEGTVLSMSSALHSCPKIQQADADMKRLPILLCPNA